MFLHHVFYDRMFTMPVVTVRLMVVLADSHCSASELYHWQLQSKIGR